jgi:Magnesium chelatase, subunit ChlI C-terminal
VREPIFFLTDNKKAGIIVHCPPLGKSEHPATPERPIPGDTSARERWMDTNFIELIGVVLRALHRLSTRSLDRLAKVARTIADLAATKQVVPTHISKACSYVVGGMLRDSS